MFCTKCGKKLPENANVCPNCGKEVKKSEINFSDVADYAGKQVNKAVEGASVRAQESMEAYRREQEEQKINRVSDIIADPNEEQIAVLGGGYLSNMLHGGGLKKGFGILTDKRFYFKGKCFVKTAAGHRMVNEEYAIDLEDITATGFVYSRRFWLLLLAILTCWTVIGGILFFALYWCMKRAFYEIYFAGGSICVNASKYGGMREVRAFNKMLRIAKDRCKK